MSSRADIANGNSRMKKSEASSSVAVTRPSQAEVRVINHELIYNYCMLILVSIGIAALIMISFGVMKISEWSPAT